MRLNRKGGLPLLFRHAVGERGALGVVGGVPRPGCVRRGGLALVAGEAGAGKTTLLRAFLESLDDSTLVIEGACDPLTTPRPLSPLHDFAADPDSGLSGLEFDRDPIEIFNEVLDRLRHTARPVVMTIEDIHWADEATLDFLRFLGRRMSDSKAILVCTYRDDEVGPDHPLRPVLGQLIPLAWTHRLTVPPLSVAAVTRLATDRGVDPRDLMRLTDGNAFFLTEVLASGEGLPETVQEAVLARVARLDERPRRVVEGVSVAPRSLPIEHAATIVGGTLDDIDAALAAGVLIGDGHSLRFRHELARSAVEQSLPPARRLGLHMRMLGILEEEQNPDLARLAHHAVRAGRSDLIVEYAPLAGDEAVRNGSRREAVAFYRAALDHADDLGADRMADLRVKLGAELRLLDEPEASEVELRLAIDHYRESGAVERLADALGQLQGALWNLRRFEEGRDATDEALTLLRPQGASEALGMTLYRIAHHQMLARHGQLAFTHIEEAGRVADGVDSAELHWLVLMITGCIHIVLGDSEKGLLLLQESVTKAEALDDPRLLAIGLTMLGSGGGEARRYQAAIPALERGIEQGLATDADYSVAYNRSWLARIAFEQGRWDVTVDLADLVDRTTLQREGIAYITAMSALGRVRVRRGDPGGLVLLEEMTELARDHELQHGWNAICGRAEHFWLSGRPEAGLDELKPAFRRALETDSGWARGEIGFWMWRLGLIDSPPEGAAEAFALQMAGDWQAAAEKWGEIGCPYEVAMALADGTEEAKLEALEIFDRLDARPMADRVRSQLRDLGLDRVPRGPTKATLSNPAGLTSRQLEVLRLMADGLSNSQIADKLYVSKKTVEHHVSAVYSKLGVSSRPKAIRAAVEMGAVEK
ncbi:MAG TPA: AAA family ATPase [Acidimicrobiia bacterium]|nr:AAA family ATPase [Acidimicrobiia bacterium]